MDSSLVLAVDLGTSRVKAGLFDLSGEPLGAAEAPQNLRQTEPGSAEIQPPQFRESFLTALRQLFAKIPSQSPPVGAVAVSSFWHGLAGVDARNRPVTPIFTWADSRCRVQAAQLRARFSEEAVHRRTGCMLRSSFWPAKLRWLRSAAPQWSAETRRWVSPADWLEAEFCGRLRGGVGLASGSGLLDVNLLDWDSQMLEACSLTPERLAPLDERPQPVGPRLWREFPQLRKAVWFPAIGDGAAGNLGSGADSEGFAAVNLGTSAALRALKRSGPARAPLGLFCYRLDRRAHLVGGASSNSGNLHQWCARELRVGEREESSSARRNPRHGLTVVPFWVAERAPFWDEALEGAITGFGMSTSAEDVRQALREAGDYRLAEILGALREAEPAKELRIIASGGASASRFRVQCLADVLGQPVWPTTEREASLRGAAVHVLRETGHDPRPARLSEPLCPDPEITAEHDRLRRRQRALERALKPLRRE